MQKRSEAASWMAEKAEHKYRKSSTNRIRFVNVTQRTSVVQCVHDKGKLLEELHVVIKTEEENVYNQNWLPLGVKAPPPIHHKGLHIVTNSGPPGVRSAALHQWRPSRPPDGQFGHSLSGTTAKNRLRTGI